MRISDAFGRCIHDVPGADGTRERVSLANLANGLYYVVVSTGHETVTRSVVLLR